ncbi:hypothetical protein EDB84DRAFT_1650996 [Lactarius hengduanensis]|nr:hypothetical protein EDB84DRAFT_1650996 [Lactarius hengduanensis]
MAYHARGVNHSHAVTANILPDNVFLEIFAFCVRDPCKNSVQRMMEWQRLVHVCRGWRQIIYASPRYLDLLLCYSKRTPVGSLGCWPAFPIAISYGILDDEDAAITLLKHPDRVRFVDLSIASSRLEKVVAAMQEPFPVLTHLKLFACVDLPDVPVPNYQRFFCRLCDLVSLQLDNIPQTGYISPEAMVAGLARLTKLETLCIHFQSLISLPEQRTRPLDPPMRAVLSALTVFEFWGHSEYFEDLVAQLDAPRLNDVRVVLDGLDSFQLPQFSLFVARTENLRFSPAQFSTGEDTFELDQFDHTHGEI